MMTKFSCVGVAIVLGGFFACGGNVSKNSAPPAQTATDAGGNEPEAEAPEAAVEEPPPVDHGAPSSTYPAFTPTFGEVQDQGGLVMRNPVIVAVTWDDDPSQAAYEAFADNIGATTYWAAVTSEYGVGPAISGTANHAHVTTAIPTGITDTDLQDMVSTNAGVTSGWPASTPDTVYAFFLPPNTSLTGVPGIQGDTCASGVGGYHAQVSETGSTYAVVPSCNFKILPSPAVQTQASMSHELIESTTDPQPDSDPGYILFGIDPFAFEAFYINYEELFRPEVSDACEIFDGIFFEDTETTPTGTFDSFVQRSWSNKAGPAGHDPCVPQPATEVYFNVAPLDLQMVNVSVPGQLANSGQGTATVQTHGYKIAAGSSGQFQVGFYSDASTNGTAWDISASVGNPIPGANNTQINPSSLTVSLDKTSGVNGEKAWVTVKVATTGTQFKGEFITITSSLNSASYYMPIWIGGE
jgi:hypothetical protein